MVIGHPQGVTVRVKWDIAHIQYPTIHQYVETFLMVIELLMSLFTCQFSKELCHPASSSKHKHHGHEPYQNKGIFIDENNLSVFLWRRKWGEQMTWHSFVASSSVKAWFPKETGQYFWAAVNLADLHRCDNTCWINLWHLPKPTSAENKSLSPWHAG